MPIAKDLTDWEKLGGTREELEKIVNSTPQLTSDDLKQESSQMTESDPGQRCNKRASDSGSGKASVATVLVALAKHAEMDLFHTPDLKAFATFKVDGHYETWALKSRAFKNWLSKLYFESTGKAANSQALQDSMNVLDAEAQFHGPEREVYVRVAGHDGRIYLDLCDDRWRAVEIAPGGWRITENPPVRFRRSAGMQPLPEPVKGGKWEDVRSFVNIQSYSDFVLLSCWLIAALHPSRPYPVLDLKGEQGTAKTTLSRIAKALIDPSKACLRTMPRNERDLMIAANNSHILGFDNVSFIPPWLSDAFCMLSTGGGLSTRELYTDDEEVIFDAKKPIVVDGIGEHAVKGDLIDRIIMLRLLPIPEGKREEEEKFWRRFESAHPRILGALLHAACVALRRLPSVHIDQKPRMADFAVWATAAEEGFGFQNGAFLKAYRSNRAEANHVALESTPLAMGLLILLNNKEMPWDPTTPELLEELNTRADEDAKKQRSWPRNDKALSNGLERAAPSLRAAGFNVERGSREPGTGRRIWRFSQIPSGHSQSSQTQAESPADDGLDPSYVQGSSGSLPEALLVGGTNEGPHEGCEGREFENEPSYENEGDDSSGLQF